MDAFQPRIAGGAMLGRGPVKSRLDRKGKAA